MSPDLFSYFFDLFAFGTSVSSDWYLAPTAVVAASSFDGDGSGRLHFDLLPPFAAFAEGADFDGTAAFVVVVTIDSP